MKKNLLTLAIMVVTFTFFVPTAQATTMFGDRTAWATAVGGIFQTVDVAGQVADEAILTGGTALNLPFAETVKFGSDLQALQVPSSWGTWSGGKTPRILYTQGLSSVTGSFNGSVTAFGFEMEPNSFGFFPMTLSLSDGSSLSQDVNGDAGALFFGWTDGSISSMALSISPNQEGATSDFAFGEMVKSESTPTVPETVPEPATMLLLGSGLLGMGVYARRRFRK